MDETGKVKKATKSRLLFLLRFLYENTDDEHAFSTGELIRILADNGFAANRKTIRDDIDMLCDAGYEILIDKDGKSNSYHFGSRLFEMPELKMLVDAVSSSRFISAEKSEVLIRKISSLASRYEENELTARIFAAERIKGDNGKIFLISDAANQAINRGKKISFQYYDYLPTKEKVLRHGGEVYILSPYALIWSDDRYYLVGYSDKREALAAFRIDRMTIPKILDEPAVENTSFDPADYTNKVIHMYSGPEQLVTLRCENGQMRSVIDKFGEDIRVEIEDEGHFLAEVKVQASPTFYAWVFQFGGDIRIAGPADVRKEFFAMAQKALHGK